MKKLNFHSGSVITLSMITFFLSGFLTGVNANESLSNNGKGMTLAHSCSSGTCNGSTPKPRDDRDE